MPIADVMTTMAAQNSHMEAAQADAWRTGFTRRRFLQGVGLAGVAALGSQVVTTRAAFAAAPTTTPARTAVVVFLRGAADGLRILQPATSQLGVDALRSARPQLALGDTQLLTLPGSGGWGLNKAMAPLAPFWNTGEMAFIPAVGTDLVTRSHFQAQQYLECGGASTGDGWLSRALTGMGAGSTLQAVSVGGAPPNSLASTPNAVGVTSLSSFAFPASIGGTADMNEDVIAAMYRGIDNELATQVPAAVAALKQVATMRGQGFAPPQTAYPSGNFGAALADIARMVRANVGLQVATVDVGGWDTHTSEASDLDSTLAAASAALAAFLNDLGPTLRSNVSVVVMSEFGRRVAQNGSGGSDHGHGGLMWLLGGGLRQSQVAGKWAGLDPVALNNGDVPALNSPFDVLGELIQRRMKAGSPTRCFPGAGKMQTLNLFTT